MKIKSLIFGLVIGLLIGFTAGYSFLLQTEMKDLSQEIDTLETHISELQSQLSSLNQTRVVGVYFSPKGGCEN